MVLVSVNMLAWTAAPWLQDDPTRRNYRQERQNRLDGRDDGTSVTAQPEIEEDEEIPDSLLHPRWKIQRTQPITQEDFKSGTADLSMPQNIEQKVEYNDTLGGYLIGSKMNSQYLGAPLLMTAEEFGEWCNRQLYRDFFRKKNDEIYKAKGKEKFDFTDMHFELGPAEKIFGPGGVRVKTQGTAELKIGATMKNVDNPSLPIRNRKTTTMNFDEKINLSVNGKVGDKVNLNLNYNTDATFNYDTQSMKLKYDGKEDEIIKLVEGGYVSFPSNSTLVTGASSLFGVRTDLQFGKLKLQTVVSQKKSASKSVTTKGGVQTTPFEFNVADYEENRHFFLSEFFRDRYNAAMKKLPNVMTGITINRIEVWVTNKTGTTTNTRNIVAFNDLGDSQTGDKPSFNGANTLFSALTTAYVDARNIDQTNTVLDGNVVDGTQLTGGSNYEKLESARLLSTSEYTLNQAMGYISLKTALQSDQVLAVAYEYTYNGVAYQVGEFAADVTDDTSNALFVKSLKNTSSSPSMSNWKLMMRNVYYLSSSVEKDKFRLDVKYQSDTTGVYLSYIPENQVKEMPIIRLLGADRLDNNNNIHPNGYFDYVSGYTVTNGRVFFPSVEPFGSDLKAALMAKNVPADVAEKYVFQELYDNTKTSAKQVAEKNKFILTGQYRGSSANVISLDALNVPRGSVHVTAGGQELQEGSDYTVDYNAAEVTILNQSILDAGTSVNVSLESNTDWGQMRKTMLGMNWEYDFSKNFQMSGTFQHLTEQALTTKVAMGSEPLNNTIWGVNLNWKKESQWLTNLLDKLPGLHLTQPSQISFSGEFAQLIAGQANGTQDRASYLDDFENTKNFIDVSTPTSWVMSSVPSTMPNYNDKNTVASGYDRALLSWYSIDPLFTRQGSSLTPGHIRSDLEQLSNHYVREVYVRELYPNRDQSNYNGATAPQPILNLAYYPSERGAYNLDPNLNPDGTLPDPQKRWGGMMRKLDTNDFEAANIEYLEFWMLDPFIYTGDDRSYGGELYIDLGEVSEDVLRDGKKFYESGMPVDGSNTFTTTQWGKIPTSPTVTYAFATTSGSRALQDVGYNGLNDNEERSFGSYQTFLQNIRGVVDASTYEAIASDPANDNYHYFRGSDFDREEASILKRYKRINMPQGNSPDSDSRTESYDTSYKTTPDVEDINQDYTLNEYEKYYHYHVSIHPGDTVVGQNFITDKRVAQVRLRNGADDHVTWYQYRIPLHNWESKEGAINDFSSIRFMRMYLTGFEKPIVLRFGTLDLVRGEWRVYEQPLNTGATGGSMTVSAVNIEENNDKTPVNYVLPPGIRREQDPTQPQLVESNEQALNIVVDNMANGESKAVYKNSSVDLRQYKRLEMFVHANALEQNITELKNKELAVFIRLGSDYKNNFYEYLIPLDLTEPGHYDRYSGADCRAVWPENNMLNIPLEIFTKAKKERNKAKSADPTSYGYSIPYLYVDPENPNNTVTVMGNPSLGEVKTMMIGVRNLTAQPKSGEVWINELRLKEYNNNGGWAAQGKLNVQMSDLGMINLTGKYLTEGFGGLEQGVAERSKDDYSTYTMTTNVELGKFFPDKAKVSAPVYYTVTKEKKKPKYNPLDTDMRLDDALESASDKFERDSVDNIAVTRTTTTNLALSNWRVGVATKRHPMPYDPANFSFSYSHSHSHSQGETTVYENEDQWRGSINYTYTPVYKAWEPFKGMLAKSKSKWFDILKRFGLNWMPQNVTFNTEMTRQYRELQERDMENLGGSQLPATFASQFLWNRHFTLRWDLTKNLHMTFQSATNAEIEEPYVQVNKDLYPTEYEAWKDSVWTSIKHMGTPLDYQQTFNASYQIPINLIPIFDWINSDASFNSSYKWVRGSVDEQGFSYGNNISNNRQLSLNGSFSLEKLYNHVPFLKKANERFNKSSSRNNNNRNQNKPKTDKKDKTKKDETKKEEKELPKNKRAFEQEITLLPDTAISVSHGKNSKRLIISAKSPEGKSIKLKYKVVDQNKIKILNKVDSATKIKIAVTAKEPLENLTWYKTAQVVARGLMMVRSASFSYRNQYTMALPGFMPMIGNAFGQNRRDVLAPGLDFAFGVTGDSFVEKAVNNGWLMMADSIATPATTNATEDLQLRLTLEPVKSLTIDLNTSYMQNKLRSVSYMYEGMPVNQSGTFSMTTISIKSAMEGMGNASNGYFSKTFETFCKSIDGIHKRVQARYENTRYPTSASWSGLSGQPYNEIYGTVPKYSSDVLIPAFLNAYTATSSGLDIFPDIFRMLPNWSVRYGGLVQLPWFRDHFKSVNINHSYKSIYSVGAYNTYTTWLEYMDGLGFVSDIQTGSPVPSSMYNVSTVSINEAFSPLLGMDVTFPSNLTCKLEYRTTRVMTLSVTSVQINEAISKDWVFGLGYKINNFKLFNFGKSRTVKVKGKKKQEEEKKNTNTSTTKNGVNHDMNLRFDFSLRNQASITRDIQKMFSTASSGNKALKFSFNADYSLSKMLTMSFFYDQQTNTPLLSSSSYPTTTRDFGLSVKFSLTR